jgi:integrase
MLSEVFEKLKKKGLSDSTATLYCRTLRKLNWGEDLKNLNFLKKVPEIVKRMDHLADSTRKSHLTSIISILSCFPAMKTTQDKYYKVLKEYEKVLASVDTSVATKTQKENWISWPEVLHRWESLKTAATPLLKKTHLSDAEYLRVLQFVVLSLYVLVPPKRNADWSKMVVGSGDDATKNYFDLKNKKFIFNNYKTVKTHGVLTEEVPSELFRNLKAFLKFNPLAKEEKEFPLLVFHNGKPFGASGNIMTRFLNNFFGKNFGCSMLRHAYLSNKYGAEEAEKKKDAAVMGHSLATQTNYIKDV